MRFAVAVLACFSLAATLGAAPSPAPKANALDALLARARASSGSPYLYHVRSESSETIDRQTYDVTTETEGNRYRARRCRDGLCTGFFFDGDRSYDSNFNDTALPLASGVDGLQITLRAIASYAFAAPEFRARGGELFARDPVLRAGKRYARIGVAAPLGALLDAIVDPQTGLVAGVVSDERRLAFEFADERRVNGKITLPFRIDLNGSTIERFASRGIAAEPLRAPGGLVPRIASETPIALARGATRPIVACAIGGHAARCLLDTGNSGLSISTHLREQLGLPTLALGAGSSNGDPVAGIVKAPPLTIGGATYPSAFYVVVGNLESLGYDAIVGADGFAHAAITFDGGAGTVAIFPSVPGSRGSLQFDDYTPFVQSDVDGVRTAVRLDTASIGSLESPSVSGAATTSTLAIGDATFSVATSRAADAGGSARLGWGFFSRTTTTFDYANERLTVRATKSSAR